MMGGTALCAIVRICSCSEAFSRRALLSLAAAVSVATSFSFSHGLATKSVAPALMAAMALSISE